MKIDIFGFVEDSNIGDPVIGETCKFLVERICAENNIEAQINLHPLFPPPNYKKYWITRFLRKRCRKNRSVLAQAFTLKVFNLYNKFFSTLNNYYESCLKDSDLVIFAGGGMIKYIWQEFWAADYCIVNYCDENNIPVYFNAIGVEGYDEKNLYSKLLKNLLNKPCVKGITTRDDIDSLKKYLGSTNDDLVVGDPALWSNELYPRKSEQNIVGINTIRSGIFRVNGYDIDDDKLVDFYCEFIKRLENDGHKWQLFTNGTTNDYEVGEKVLEKLGLEKTVDRIAAQPKNSQELVDLITSYKAILGSRMHAHIIATSFEIPTVGTIWNDKLKWFAKHLGAEDRFIIPSEINNYDEFYEKFKKALSEKNEKLNTKLLKEKTYNSLKKFVNNAIIAGKFS